MGAVATIAAVGAGASIYSSNKAASAQRKAAGQASATEQNAFNTAQQNLAPYNQFGQAAANQLSTQLPDLTKPVNLTQAALEATPGYQFNLSQGLKSVQNDATARGWGVSGAAQKGAANFASGLANTTYQQQFQNAVTNQQNTYNRLLGIAGLGENAAAGVGNAALGTAGEIGGNILGAGSATAASDTAIGKSINGAGQSIGNGFFGNKFTGGINNQNNGTDNGTGVNIPNFNNAFANSGTGASSWPW